MRKLYHTSKQIAPKFNNRKYHKGLLLVGIYTQILSIKFPFINNSGIRLVFFIVSSDEFLLILDYGLLLGCAEFIS